MTKINDGGPVFPIPEVRDREGNGILEGWNGMSLRDYFAGQALRETYPSTPKETAERAYTIADAMLAARTKGGA